MPVCAMPADGHPAAANHSHEENELSRTALEDAGKQEPENLLMQEVVRAMGRLASMGIQTATEGRHSRWFQKVQRIPP